MTRNRLYGELAHLWPLISPPEEYTFEAGFWRDALRAKLGPGRPEVLELGVGGGHSLSHLASDFRFTAVDISPQMVALSQRLNPGVEHHVGDMRTLRLGRTFSAVIIHDAISYMLTEEDLAATFATARAHLPPGGVFITAPDFYVETFPGPTVSHSLNRDGETDVAFIEYYYDPDPDDTTAEAVFLYLIRKGKEVRIEEDRHTWGLFPLAAWERLLAEATFSVERLPYPVHDGGHQAYLLVGILNA